jgi:hypothetical protein
MSGTTISRGVKLRLASPIPPSPDLEELKKIYKELGIIPYFGNEPTQGTLFLQLIKEICGLSPTFEATMYNKNKFTFGSQTKIGSNTRPGLYQENQAETPLATQEAYSDRAQELGIPLNQILVVGESLNRSLAESGNAYLRIKRATVAGVVKYKMYAEHYLNCAYLVPRPGEEMLNFLLVSPYITDIQKMRDTGKWKILQSVAPGEPLIWSKKENGVEHAIVHIMEQSGTEPNSVYGRSRQLSCLMAMYAEYYQETLNAKVSSTDIVTKLLIAMEGPSPENYDMEDFENEEIYEVGNTGIGAKRKGLFERNMDRIKMLTTNVGSFEETSSIFGMEYPAGANAPTPIKLDLNRDVNYNSWSTDRSSRVIAAVNGYFSDLLNLTKTPSGIGGNMLKDLFLIMRAGTIGPDQAFWETVLNGVLKQIPELDPDLGLKLLDNVEQLVQSLANQVPAANVTVGI